MVSRALHPTLAMAVFAAVLATACTRTTEPADNADAPAAAARAPAPGGSQPEEARTGYNPEAYAYVADDPQCRPHLALLHRVPGVPREWIVAALAGDAASSGRIQRNLLARIEGDHEHERVPGLLCASGYWRDIAAQHGDIHAAYEASFPTLDSPGRCARARHWAAFGLAHLDDYRKGMLADAPAESVAASLDVRRGQFETTLATPCPPASPPPTGTSAPGHGPAGS